MKREVKNYEQQLQQVINDEIAVMFDRNMLQRFFGAVTALMIAVSAYAYMV